MRTVLLGALVGAAMLSACATPFTPEQLAAKAKEDSTPNLCAITLMGVSVAVTNAAMNEIQARGETCDWKQAGAIAEAQMTQRRLAEEAQHERSHAFVNNLATAATIMQQSGAGQRYYAPAPVQTHCIQQGIYMNCSSY